MNVSVPAVELGNRENISKVVTFMIPLFIVLYYMYLPSEKTWGYISGLMITFMIGLFVLFCRCDTPQMNTSYMLIALILYCVLTMIISLNMKKLSKARYFVLNMVVQYSIFLNLYALGKL